MYIESSPVEIYGRLISRVKWTAISLITITVGITAALILCILSEVQRATNGFSLGFSSLSKMDPVIGLMIVSSLYLLGQASGAVIFTSRSERKWWNWLIFLVPVYIFVTLNISGVYTLPQLIDYVRWHFGIMMIVSVVLAYVTGIVSAWFMSVAKNGARSAIH